jgi:hypothetical protein
MTYRILQYIQPWEIDDLERQINVMILGSYYIKNPKDVIWKVVMNTEVADWEKSKIGESYFVEKFEYLSSIVSKYFTSEFSIDNQVKGCTDLRRSAVHTEQDYVIWLDSDLFFSYLTLPYLINASESIPDKVYMISPEIIKYWDNSWDIIVHNKFLNEPYNHRDYFDLHSLNKIVTENEFSLDKNYNIKFGGGWFNLFSNDMVKSLPIPEEIGAYGPDDTYYSLCGVRKRMPQYILRGVVVSEIGNSFLEKKGYLKNQMVSKIADKAKISDQEFHNIIKRFYESN